MDKPTVRKVAAATPLPCFRLTVRVRPHLLVARLQLGFQLRQLIFQTTLLAPGLGLVPAQNVPYPFTFHLAHLLAEQAQLQGALTQEPANLGVGQSGDIPQSGGAQGLLPFTLHHPPIPHKDPSFASQR